MIASFLYAHRSLYGADGYGFVGSSESADTRFKGELHTLINRLGYDHRTLKGREALFWLRIGDDWRVAGRVRVRQSQGKSTLIYQLLVITNWSEESRRVSPLMLLDVFDAEADWQPDSKGRLAPLTLDRGQCVASTRPVGFGSLTLPPGFAKSIERQVIVNWWHGLSYETQRDATFLLPESGDPRAMSAFRGSCHLSEGVAGSADLDESPEPSGINSAAPTLLTRVRTIPVVTLLIGVVTGWVGAWLFGFSDNRPSAVPPTAERPAVDFVQTPTSGPDSISRADADADAKFRRIVDAFRPVVDGLKSRLQGDYEHLLGGELDNMSNALDAAADTRREAEMRHQDFILAMGALHRMINNAALFEEWIESIRKDIQSVQDHARQELNDLRRQGRRGTPEIRQALTPHQDQLTMLIQKLRNPDVYFLEFLESRVGPSINSIDCGM